VVDFIQLLSRLSDYQVEYVLVGGLAAATYGSYLAPGFCQLPTQNCKLLASDCLLLTANFQLTPYNRIKQATQAANALLKLRSTSRLKTRP
jgi:hypothetical protein